MKYTLLAAAAATAGKEISIGEAAATAVFGYCVVFFGLIILMCVLYGTGAYFKSKDEKANAAKKAAAAAEAPAKTAPAAEAPAKTAPAAPAPEKPKAPGSAGHIKLHDVPDKDAAMIMAIVADKMQKPINELHFISIKEVK